MDNNQQPQQVYKSLDKFDRMMGALVNVPDVYKCKPATVRTAMPITGEAQTFIVQTFRHRENGDICFIEYLDAAGTLRLFLPPRVVNTITRQLSALTSISRKRAARQTAADRKALGLPSPLSDPAVQAKARKARKAKRDAKIIRDRSTAKGGK